MTAYYNEHNKFAAHWLRELIAWGLIAPGDVDDRDIRDVLPSDLVGYSQCHFFAGIGGWSLALRMAGWGDDRAAWTGSCPCQPFSKAGRRGGFADERHLWPAFHYLIEECRPTVVFGEQIADRAGLEWLDLVHADMEGTGYTFGSADLCAAGVAAPHIRQRLFWVGDAGRQGLPVRQREEPQGQGWRAEGGTAQQPGRPFWAGAEWVPCRDGRSRAVEPGLRPLAHGVLGRVELLRGAGNAVVPQVGAAFVAAFMDSQRRVEHYGR